MTEAPITTTLKAPGANAPWIVIRSDDTSQLHQQLAEIQHNGTFAELARANEAFAAHYTTGAILGARPVDAPVSTGAFTPPATATAVAPAAPAAPEDPMAALQAQLAALQAAQAAPAAAPAAPAGGTPGAPMVAGMPAKLVSGTSAKGTWQAWADPRPKDATDHMAKTDDVNHPGLTQGTHKLWKFIR